MIKMPRPVVGITMGDPAGIGPEIILKALRRPLVHSLCRPVVFGTARFFENPAVCGRFQPKCEIIEAPADASFRKGKICIVEVEASRRIRVGKKSASSGRAALAYLDRAIHCSLQNEVGALVTAPVSKAAIRMAGKRDFIGHTEYLAQSADANSVVMMFYGKRLKVALVTTHLPLQEVSSSISTERILTTIGLSNAVLKRLDISSPRIGVAGLNPHAGEEGAFGDEDACIIAPAVRRARARGIQATGPLPADTLFHAAYKGEYDLVVSMYHDQALAPFKMVSFENGVNMTLGLPFVRTSVDHGTAFDIAGRGIASEKSLVEAIKLAAKLAK
jgi:4-hydroxythreonine-4-phosphate dehydrogenase